MASTTSIPLLLHHQSSHQEARKSSQAIIITQPQKPSSSSAAAARLRRLPFTPDLHTPYRNWESGHNVQIFGPLLLVMCMINFPEPEFDGLSEMGAQIRIWRVDGSSITVYTGKN